MDIVWRAVEVANVDWITYIESIVLLIRFTVYTSNSINVSYTPAKIELVVSTLNLYWRDEISPANVLFTVDWYKNVESVVVDKSMKDPDKSASVPDTVETESVKLLKNYHIFGMSEHRT